MPHAHSCRSASLPLLLLLASTAALGGDHLPTIDDDVLTTYRQVTWEDFRGRRITFRGAQQARIATGIEMRNIELVAEEQPDGRFRGRPDGAEVFAVMQKLESGYRRGGRSDWALAHEQGHFDVTEIHARRLRQRVEELTVEGAGPEEVRDRLEQRLATLYEESLQRWEEEQARYDAETGHGTSKKAQKRWWRDLERRLAETHDPLHDP